MQTSILVLQVSSRAAAAAQRRSESLERRAAEAAREAEAAQSVTVRSETARAEAERALAGLQASVARALGAVEDALVDALKGVGAGVGVAGEERQGERFVTAEPTEGRGAGVGAGLGGGRGYTGPAGVRRSWASIGGDSNVGGGQGLRVGRERQMGRFPPPPPPNRASRWGASPERSLRGGGVSFLDRTPAAASTGKGGSKWLGTVEAPVGSGAEVEDEDGDGDCDAAARAAAATAMTGRCVGVLHPFCLLYMSAAAVCASHPWKSSVSSGAVFDTLMPISSSPPLRVVH